MILMNLNGGRKKWFGRRFHTSQRYQTICTWAESINELGTIMMFRVIDLHLSDIQGQWSHANGNRIVWFYSVPLRHYIFHFYILFSFAMLETSFLFWLISWLLRKHITSSDTISKFIIVLDIPILRYYKWKLNYKTYSVQKGKAKFKYYLTSL